MPESVDDIAQSISLDEVVAIANTVKDAIVREYENRGKFTDIERCPVEGLISQCGGALSLLLLANGFPKEIELGKAWEEVVFPEARKVFTYVKEKGFDATPFMAAEKTVRIGIGKKLPYIDSLTWVLSLALHLRLAQQKKRVNLPSDIELQMGEAIKETLKQICEAMHPDGGWGFIKDCSSPDLYFSYAVSEALADFGDYVLGETSDIAERDVELIKSLSSDESKIIESVAAVREKTSEWLIKNYLSDLGEKLIVPDLKPDDFQAYHSLYYTYFVIDMLIVLGAGELFHQDRRKEILKAIEHGIYLSRMTLDRARADTGWFDTKKSELRLGWHNHAKSGSLMAGDSIKEPGLVPLSVRCNALYAYYIAEGPVREIDGLFGLLCENRDVATGLWDNQGFDLMITERAVEALVDYADYLREYKAEKHANAGESTESRSPDAQVSSIVATSKTTPTIEGLLHSMIEEQLRSILASPAGKELIRNAADSVGRQELAIDDDSFLEKLQDAMVVSEKYLKGNPSTGVSIDKTQSFCQSFSEFLFTLFVQRLSLTLSDGSHSSFVTENQELVENRKRELFLWIANRVARNPELATSDLLDHLADAYAANTH
ncbi:MAG: hypothetical protein WAQ99_08075 [Pyrinomonadaceae bacterium]